VFMEAVVGLCPFPKQARLRQPTLGRT
jgi:hypothetical protein